MTLCLELDFIFNIQEKTTHQGHSAAVFTLEDIWLEIELPSGIIDAFASYLVYFDVPTALSRFRYLADWTWDWRGTVVFGLSGWDQYVRFSWSGNLLGCFIREFSGQEPVPGCCWPASDTPGVLESEVSPLLEIYGCQRKEL